MFSYPRHLPTDPLERAAPEEIANAQFRRRAAWAARHGLFPSTSSDWRRLIPAAWTPPPEPGDRYRDHRSRPIGYRLALPTAVPGGDHESFWYRVERTFPNQPGRPVPAAYVSQPYQLSTDDWAAVCGLAARYWLDAVVAAPSWYGLSTLLVALVPRGEPFPLVAASTPLAEFRCGEVSQ